MNHGLRTRDALFVAVVSTLFVAVANAAGDIPAHVPPKEVKYDNPPTVEPADDTGKSPVMLPQLPPKLLPVNYQPNRFPSDPFEAHGKSIRDMPVADDKASPPGRWLHSMVTIKDNVYIYGGVSNSETLLNDVWVYNPTEGTWWKLETATKPQARKPVNPRFKNSKNQGRPPFLPAPPHFILPPGVKRPEELAAKKNENPENKELNIVHLAPIPSEEPQQPYAQSIDEYKKSARRRRLLALDLTKEQRAVLNRHAAVLSSQQKANVGAKTKAAAKQALRANKRLRVQQAAAKEEPAVGQDKNTLEPKPNTHVLSQPVPINICGYTTLPSATGFNLYQRRCNLLHVGCIVQSVLAKR